jgi:hypothetical protein
MRYRKRWTRPGCIYSQTLAHVGAGSNVGVVNLNSVARDVGSKKELLWLTDQGSEIS